MRRKDRDGAEITGFVDFQFHFQIIETLGDYRIDQLDDLNSTDLFRETVKSTEQTN